MFRIYKDIDIACQKHIMEFIRSTISSEILRGIPVKRTDELLLLKRINHNFYFDGFTLIRIADIDRYRLNNHSQDFLKKVQKVNRLYIQKEDFSHPSIASWRDFFEDITKLTGLISLYRISAKEKIFQVGKIESISSETVELKTVDEAAYWRPSVKSRYLSPSFCRIDYGDRYTEVLRKMAR